MFALTLYKQQWMRHPTAWGGSSWDSAKQFCANESVSSITAFLLQVIPVPLLGPYIRLRSHPISINIYSSSEVMGGWKRKLSFTEDSYSWLNERWRKLIAETSNDKTLMLHKTKQLLMLFLRLSVFPAAIIVCIPSFLTRPKLSFVRLIFLLLLLSTQFVALGEHHGCYHHWHDGGNHSKTRPS